MLLFDKMCSCLSYRKFTNIKSVMCSYLPENSMPCTRSNFANLVQPFPSFSITNHPTDFVLSIVIDMLQSKRKHK